MRSLTGMIRRVRHDKFPSQGIEQLSREGLLMPSQTLEACKPAASGAPQMFKLLSAIGRGDLALGRLYEGHVNAVGLIERYGNHAQRNLAERLSSQGHLLGVWGADDGARPGRLSRGTLQGRKTYASGADKIGAAIIIVKDEEERSVMVLVPTERLAGRFDPTWWQPMGMTTTDSFAVDLEGLETDPDDLIGMPDDYLTQPLFGGGAIRFVAVQLGGLLAVWDAMLGHLTATGRADDPIQAARLGHVMAQLEAVHAGVEAAYRRLAPALCGEEEGNPEDALIADAARTLTYRAGGAVMEEAVQAVGCPGLMAGHDLERALRDLTVYLRQPAPDAALLRAARGAAAGHYRPLFDG
ncbi:MAG: acyl-CoA dehydrogenase family protein [Parvularcula sp.]|nr:acyl-CoA dehydrogenase family protein [Parvularcula sp.]